MSVDQGRLWRRIETLSRITDPERPWTRRSFTPCFLKGRDWLAEEFRAAGLDTEIDAGGNLIGTLCGADPSLKPILVGSHSDTVPSGGRYDGILGVLSGLEVAQSFSERGDRLRHTLQVVDFLAEEPSDFGLSCIGSRALAGALTEEHLGLRRSDGTTLRDGLSFVGGRPDRLSEVARAPGSIAAYLEVHIEQGRVLESEQVPIGIVTDIVGIRREIVTITGRADHSGTTPMPLRRDALVGAARLIAAAYERALGFAHMEKPLVATVGRIDISPNAANAVPGEAVLTLEVRCGDEPAMTGFGEGLVDELSSSLRELGLTVSSELISHVAPTACAPQIRSAIAHAAASFGKPTRNLPSGAGHDGVFLSRLGPVGMIFVPCRDGRSHAPDESIEVDQAGDGAMVLAETVRLLDTTLS